MKECAEVTEINHDSLISAGFEPCIFAPIYIANYSYYLGNLDWSKGKDPSTGKFLCNNLNWKDAKLLIAVSADGKSYIDYWSHKRFWSIEEIKRHCQENGIEMTSSKRPKVIYKEVKKTEKKKGFFRKLFN